MGEKYVALRIDLNITLKDVDVETFLEHLDKICVGFADYHEGYNYGAITEMEMEGDS